MCENNRSGITSEDEEKGKVCGYELTDGWL